MSQLLNFTEDHEHKRKLELEAELLKISKNEKPTSALQFFDSSHSNPIEPEWFTVAKNTHASTQKQSILKEVVVGGHFSPSYSAEFFKFYYNCRNLQSFLRMKKESGS